VTAAFTANVWDIKVAVGDAVEKNQLLLVLEAMKMESPIHAPVAGTVKAVKAVQGGHYARRFPAVVVEESK